MRPTFNVPTVLTALAAAGALRLAVAGAESSDPRSPVSNPSPRAGAVDRSAAGDAQEFPIVPYDGTYTFVRVRFNTGEGESPAVSVPDADRRGPHDYPYADENFVRILDEVTLLGPNTEGTSVIGADDPVLHRHPIAYVSEPGYWAPTRAEVDNVSAFLRKGGFLILDDFRGSREWSNVEAIFKVVLPGHRFRVLDVEEPVFDSFFRIETLDIPPPTFPQYEPVFLGIHEDDDPGRRLMVVANFNNDIGDYWEYSDLGYFPIDLSNEAYKFGVNYVIYAMNR